MKRLLPSSAKANHRDRLGVTNLFCLKSLKLQLQSQTQTNQRERGGTWLYPNSLGNRPAAVTSLVSRSYGRNILPLTFLRFLQFSHTHPIAPKAFTKSAREGAPCSLSTLSTRQAMGNDCHHRRAATNLHVQQRVSAQGKQRGTSCCQLPPRLKSRAQKNANV